MMINSEQWAGIRQFVAYLDAANGRSDAEVQTRIMKISEELGEVTSAYIGAKGLNPRKGVTHTNKDLCDELADVIIGAAIALATVCDGDPAEALNDKLAVVVARAKAKAVPPQR